MSLFDPQFLEQLEYLALVSRKAFRGRLLSQHRGQRSGSGVEFAEHRDYQPGDELRDIDWNVYARHGELLLKRFQEEEDLHVYFLLDCSQSMACGSPSKFDHARRVLAALAYIALDDLDCVRVSTFADDLRGDFPKIRGKQRIHTIMGYLEDLETRSGAPTALQQSVRAFANRRQRRGLVVVLSDLYDPGGFERAIDLLRHERYEPYLVQVFDRQEASPPLRGEYELLDIETNEVQTVSVSRQQREAYMRRYEAFQSSVVTYCRKYQLGAVLAPTDRAYDQLILDMMRVSGRSAR